MEEEEEEDEVKFIPMIILSMILPTGEGYGTESLHLELTPAATTLYTTLPLPLIPINCLLLYERFFGGSGEFINDC